MITKKLLLIFFVFVNIETITFANEVIDINSSLSYRYINTQIMCFVDKSESLKINDILNLQNNFYNYDPDRFINFPKGTHWYKISINNTSSDLNEVILELQSPALDYVSLYQFNQNKLQKSFKTGDLLPFKSKPIYCNNFAFPLTLIKGINILYISINTHSPLFFPVYVYANEIFYKKIVIEDILISILFSTIFCFLLYYFRNLIISTNTLNIFKWQNDETIYYKIFGVIICLLYVYLQECGWTYKFIFPEKPFIDDLSFSLCMLLAGICGLSIIKSLGEITFSNKILFFKKDIFYKFLKFSVSFFQILYILLFILIIIGFYNLRRTVHLSFMIGCCFCTLLTVLVYYDKNTKKNQKYLIYGGVFYSFTLAFNIYIHYIVSLGIFPHYLTNLIYPILHMIGIFIWSFALAELNIRYNLERKQYEIKLIKKYRHKHYVQEEFINDLSHELVTPIYIILGSSFDLKERLQNTTFDENNKAIINRISSASLRVKCLIDNFLNNARNEANIITTKFQYESIDNLINNIIQSLEPLIHEKKQTITFINDYTYPISSYIDKFGFEQIISNLIRNAIKFTPINGYIYIIIDKSSNKVIIKIIDNGIGIHDKSDDIYKPFYKDTYLDTAACGVGLGLAIARKWIEIHHGTIKFISPLPDSYRARFNLSGTGTIFIIQLQSER